MPLTKSLLVPIGLFTFLLGVDAAVSIGLVSTMVAFLHGAGAGPFPVAGTGGAPFSLAGTPANLVTNPGHVANAAGGTALVLVGFGGIAALWLERRRRKQWGKSHPAFYIWAVIVLLSFLLTLAALIYTFVETSKTSGQVIDLAVAQANLPPAQYPDGSWTPETWYSAVLDLPLLSGSNARIISGNVGMMRGWRLNLLVLLTLGFILLVFVVFEVWRTIGGGTRGTSKTKGRAEST